MIFSGCEDPFLEITVVFPSLLRIGSDLLGMRTRRGRSMHQPRTLVDNERLGPQVQNTITPEVRFRAELSEYGVERWKLARV